MAQTINNYGPPKRGIAPQVRQGMIEVLKPTGPACVGLASTQGDFEAHEFKLQLIGVFRDAGRDVRDMETFMFFSARKRLVVTIPSDTPESGVPQIVARAPALTGNPVVGNRGDMAKDCGVYVQVWGAPEK